MNPSADPADPADPAKTRHGAWCTTPGTLAPEVRMTVILNKLPQITLRLLHDGLPRHGNVKSGEKQNIIMV